tara:strand:+ start:917 stop:1456 length:540 start_codon:yes stop_codon:yes gene_type:complete
MSQSVKFKKLDKALNDFGRFVVSQARANLTRKKKNVSRKLYDSINYELVTSGSGQSFTLKLKMLEYGEYQDQGVSGTEKKYNTRFKYTNRRPPAKVFDKWIVKRGLEGIRDEQGRFVTRKSLQYAIATSVYKRGIRPSYFFTRAFNLGFKKLPKEVREAFALDVRDFLEFTLKNNFKET